MASHFQERRGRTGVDFAVPGAVILGGVLLNVGLVYIFRHDPAWQRDLPRIRILLFGQVALLGLIAVAAVMTEL